MIILIQRVSEGHVTIDREPIAQIGPGLLALVAIERDDTEREADRLLERVASYRVFEDDSGRMNVSLTDAGAALLLVPQFTLAADTDKGTRPGFSRAADPAEGRRLFDYLVARAQARLETVETGRFGAHMAVSLTNDGPVTFWLRVKPATQ